MTAVGEPASELERDSAPPAGIEDEEPDWMREFDDAAALKKKQEQQRRRDERIRARLDHQQGVDGVQKARSGKMAMFGGRPDALEAVTTKKKPDQLEANVDDEEFLAENWDSDDERKVARKRKRRQASLPKQTGVGKHKQDV